MMIRSLVYCFVKRNCPQDNVHCTIAMHFDDHNTYYCNCTLCNLFILNQRHSFWRLSWPCWVWQYCCGLFKSFLVWMRQSGGGHSSKKKLVLMMRWCLFFSCSQLHSPVDLWSAFAEFFSIIQIQIHIHTNTWKYKYLQLYIYKYMVVVLSPVAQSIFSTWIWFAGVFLLLSVLC